MRVALVGCGLIAGVHAQALTELGHRLEVVVDSHLPRAADFAAQWRAARWGEDFNLALAEGIDCVHICTPPALHPEMIRAALQAGKHVVCEKPMCLNPAEALELTRLARLTGRVGAVNFNVRFYHACQQAREWIAASEFGAVCLIHGSYLQEFHALPDQYTWRYRPELAGPMRATTEIGSHWLDLARFWTGLEISAVCANYGSFTPERYLAEGTMYAQQKEGARPIRVESEDAAVISIRFSNGAIGSLLLSEVSHGRNNRVSIEVSSPRQSIWWNSEHPFQLHQGQKFGGVNTQTQAFTGGFADTFKAFFAAVYQDIQAGQPAPRPAYPTFYDGYINSSICAAVYASASHNSAWVPILLED